MKIKHLLIALAAVTMLFGCETSEVNTPENDGKAQYMSFHISTPATRAANTVDGGFTYGSEQENAIKSIYFFFYKDGAYVSWGKGTAVTALYTGSDGEIFVPDPTTLPDVEEIWRKSDGKGVVVIESPIDTKPNQVLCVVNSPNPTFFKNKTLNAAVEALQLGTDGVKGNFNDREIGFVTVDGTTPYFCMTNSPVVKNGKIEYALSFEPEGANKKIYYTAKEASEDPVEIYVERLAAKVEVQSLTATLDTDLATEWAVELTNWGMNGVNRNGYHMKHIDAAWVDASNTTFAAWINSPNRVNWALDPNYADNDTDVNNEDLYPGSAEAWEKDAASGNPRVSESCFTYYSKDDIDGFAASTATAVEKLKRNYVFENTFGAAGQKKARLVGSNMMVFARVKAKSATAYVDLFDYMGVVYDLKEYTYALLSNSLDQFDFFISDGAATPTYTKLEAADVLDATKSAAIIDLFEVKKAVKEDKFNTVGDPDYGYYKIVNDTNWSDGYVTLYPKSTTTLYVYDSTTDTYSAAAAADIRTAFLHDNYGLANAYKEGWMWYAVPVEHTGKATVSATDKTPLEGNYGIVRNSWYQITLGTIKSLGHGIWDPSEPIVPGEKAEKWYIGAKINVNAWHVIQQNSDLEE